MTAAVRAQLAAHGAKLPAETQKHTATPTKPQQRGVTAGAGVGGDSGAEIAFNCVVPGNNGALGLLRSHWTRKRRLLTEYEYVVAAARLKPLAGPVRLELVRYSIGPAMDYDNLVSTGKLLVDALVRCGVLPDDNPTVIPERHYSQVRAEGKGYQRTVIRLLPL